MNLWLQHCKILSVSKCNYVKQVYGKHERYKGTCPFLLAGSSWQDFDQMQSWPSSGGWCPPCQQRHSFSSGSLCTAQLGNWLPQEGRVTSICLSIYLAIWGAILMVNELLSHLSNTPCVFKAFWQDFICLLTWGLHKPAGVCVDNTRLNASPHPYTSNVCLFCCTGPGWISSPAPPAQAVPHRAAGQATLSLHHLTRRRDGAAQLWVCLETCLWALWWTLWWVLVSACLRDGGTLSFKKSNAVLFTAVLLGTARCQAAGVWE